MDGLKEERQHTRNRSNRGRIRTTRHSVHKPLNTQNNRLDVQIESASKAVDGILPLVNEAKITWDKKKNELDNFEKEFKYISVEKLREYSKNIVIPAVKY